MNSTELNIYTTVSDGRTHIAYGKNYVGNVNTYNNFFTKFFAWLFQLSTSVNFGGKNRSVNKKSYVKLLGNLGVKSTEWKNLDPYIVFKEVVKSHKLIDQGYMRDHIAEKKKQKLFKKLAFSISKCQQARALKMIHKGALLDQDYYDRKDLDLDPSFHSHDEGLEYEGQNYAFFVFKAAPILQAAKKVGDSIVVRELANYGADLNRVGEKYRFTRTVTIESTYDPFLAFGGMYHHNRMTFDFGPSVDFGYKSDFGYASDSPHRPDFRYSHGSGYVRITKDSCSPSEKFQLKDLNLVKST